MPRFATRFESWSGMLAASSRGVIACTEAVSSKKNYVSLACARLSVTPMVVGRSTGGYYRDLAFTAVSPLFRVMHSLVRHEVSTR